MLLDLVAGVCSKLGKRAAGVGCRAFKNAALGVSISKSGTTTCKRSESL